MVLSNKTVAKIAILTTLIGAAIGHLVTQQTRVSYRDLTKKTKKVVQQEQTTFQEMLNSAKAHFVQGDVKAAEDSLKNLDMYVRGLAKFPGYKEVSSEIIMLTNFFSYTARINKFVNQVDSVFSNFIDNENLLDKENMTEETIDIAGEFVSLHLVFRNLYLLSSGVDSVDIAKKEAIKNFVNENAEKISNLISRFEKLKKTASTETRKKNIDEAIIYLNNVLNRLNNRGLY